MSTCAHLFCAYANLKFYTCIFQEYQITFHFKIATAHRATHGGKRINSGRKRKYEKSGSAQLAWNRQHKQIYLSLTIFESWKEAKEDAGYSFSTDSEFAAHLLSLEYRRFVYFQYFLCFSIDFRLFTQGILLNEYTLLFQVRNRCFAAAQRQDKNRRRERKRQAYKNLHKYRRVQSLAWCPILLNEYSD